MFPQLPMALNLGVFAVAAVLIWMAGTRLERLTDEIRDRTSIGGGLAGLVLLAGATSLPEVATTTTAVLRGSVDLAVANLMGSAAFQVVILVIADAVLRHRTLTSGTSFGVLVASVGTLLLFTVAAAMLVLGEAAQSSVTVAGVPVGLNPMALALVLAYVVVLAVTRAAEGQPRWRPVPRRGGGQEPGEPGRSGRSGRSGPAEGSGGPERSGRRVGTLFALAAGVVLVAGWTAASAADVLAEQTGLGTGLVGATLLAAATSLPEVSTTVAASRQGHQDMAVSNVMGSNAFTMALLVPASVLAAESFPGGKATQAALLSLLTAALTCVCLLGLLLRSRRNVLGVGLDLLAVVVLYVAGIVLIYGMAA